MSTTMRNQRLSRRLSDAPTWPASLRCLSTTPQTSIRFVVAAGGKVLRNGVIVLLCVALVAAKKSKKTAFYERPAPSATDPLSNKSYEEILAHYTFVGDFSLKEPDREVSDEIFWRYPYVLPQVEFPIEFEFKDLDAELPATRGMGRPIDHLNRGRMHFLEKDYLAAKNAWLSGRARYGKEYPEHRRSDYFVSHAFLQLAREMIKTADAKQTDPNVKNTLTNAATFLEWAFVLKAAQPDPLLDRFAPKGFYNLAAIRWLYHRYAGSYGAAEAGLNFLRQTGRKDYRPHFYRIIAESHIQNRSYLEAVQTLDQAIRHDAPRDQAAAGFARVGDIYFDLNNYELAEDAYALSARVDEDLKQLSPAQLALRGEALFWLGRFSEAQSVLHRALGGSLYRKETAPLQSTFRAWASLRIADSYLARAAQSRETARQLGLKNMQRDDRDYLCDDLEDPKSKEIPEKTKPVLAQYCNLIEKAKLEYYRVAHDYRSLPSGQIAQVRSACLELPYYGGHNVRHARELLESAKTSDLPLPIIELGWACQVSSYTQRERTPEMLDRVKKFFEFYPSSRFLGSFVEPVREFQATKINEYFEKSDIYRGMSFFEKNRKNLYPQIDAEVASKLFSAYADTAQPEKAAEFWQQYLDEEAASDIKVLRVAVVAAELADRKKTKEWQQRNAQFAKSLAKRRWTLPPDQRASNYVQRVLQVSTVDQHLDWLMNLAKFWSGKNTDYACDLELPLLSRTYDRAPIREASGVLKRLTSMIEGKLPDLFKVDSSCALSMLELEQRIMRRQPPLDEFGMPTGSNQMTALAARYVGRQNWPMVGDFLHMFWTISEHTFDDGDKPSAEILWKVLRDKAPAGSPESQFAKARLDPVRTETERMWN